MPVLTIVNHGTANSTDHAATNKGLKLVISKIGSLLAPPNFKLNEGAGTAALRATGIVSPAASGILGGLGVEANVAESVRWIKERMDPASNNPVGHDPVINLAGHSRGSITCYKIASALSKDPMTAHLMVNIFAIDPVPGNTGNAFTQNGENYKNIILGTNVRGGKSFLLLAESEHRLIFRPYVDALYSSNMPGHGFDTIPGTHGGINSLKGPEAEAAAIVLSRALKFLKRHGSEFGGRVDHYILNGSERLERYAQIMNRIKQYKKRSTVNPFGKGKGFSNFYTGGGVMVDKHRIANVLDGSNISKHEGAVMVAGNVGQHDFHGKNLGAALTQMTGEDAHAMRAHRFFCNGDHQKLFSEQYTQLFGIIHRLEKSGVSKMEKENITKIFLGGGNSMFGNMSLPETIHIEHFLEKRGIDLA